jgi:hypothetical protein
MPETLRRALATQFQCGIIGIEMRYETKWAEVERAADAAIVEGATSASEMLIRLAPTERYIGIEDELVRRLKLPTLPNGEPLLMLRVVNGDYSLMPPVQDDTLIDVLAQRLRQDTDVVLELGCGWGRNLFRLSGKTLFRPRFVGGEPTEAGRRVAEKISVLDRRHTYSFHSFDYRNPDFTFIGQQRRGIVFTCHSVEQVEVISPTALLGAMECFDECIGVHYEPVGWQNTPGILDQAREIQGRAWEIDKSKLHLNAARHALEAGYNRNLVSVLNDLEAQGTITIETRVWDLFGSNPFNPSSLIVWTRR